MKKKVLAVLMSLGLVASMGLAACGGGGASSTSSASGASDASSAASAGSSAASSVTDQTGGEGGQVGICLPARDQYWTTFETNVVADLEAAGYTTQVVVAGDKGEDVSAQMGQVETFANNGFAAVVIGMATGGSAADFLQRTGDMKVVFFNRAAEEGSTDGSTSVYIGMAEYDAGIAQGEWLANYFKEQGKTDLKGMMFLGELGQDSVTYRTQGAKDALEQAGFNVEWVFENTGKWDRTEAMNLFTQFYGTGTEFDFVCCNNDDMALGVIEACTAGNIEINFPIVGVDATEPGLNAVKDGTLVMTVDQDPQGQAVIVTQAISDLLAGSTLEPTISTPANPVTADNVEEVFTAKFG